MSEALAHGDIARRISDYFGRQIAHFEGMRDELEELASGTDVEHLDRIIEDDARRARSGKDLEDEFRALKKEWDDTESIPDEAEAAVRALAERAAELATGLQRAFEQAAQHSQGQAATLSDRLGELRQGRDWLTKYRPVDTPDGGYIDRQV